MSKYVKDLVTRDIQRRLDGVEDAVLVSYVGMDANATNELRGELDEKNIKMMVVKNSLARRATEGTQLAAGLRRRDGTDRRLLGIDRLCFAGQRACPA